jgi:metallo-beta-lactamase family protein
MTNTSGATDVGAAPERPSLTFLGAARTVTGSKFLLDAAGARVLLDCGLYQGARELRRRNWEDLPFDPARLDAVVLTHAHLDHCGALPLLVRQGFSGQVLCTPSTARLAAIVLRDAAHLQEDEAAYANRMGFSKHAPALPLFDGADAEKAVRLLRPVPHDQPVELPGGTGLTLRRAGHILGSAFAELDVEGVRLLVSGDLGRAVHPLLLPPARPRPSDVVVVESTYGDRRHEETTDEDLASAVRRTVARGGTCLLPAFAVDRTPVVLMTLARLQDEGRVPEVPVYVDSPMALHALDVYREAVSRGDSELRPQVVAGGMRLPRDLRLVPDAEGSARLNRPRHPGIIVSASGMATGGRVLHHLAEQLPQPRNSVVLTGFQVPGTRGRALADGAGSVKIHGRYVPVRAEVCTVRGLSAHADAEETLGWLSEIDPATAYVVHGEPDAADTLARRLEGRGWLAVVPRYQERVRLR